MTEVLAVIGLLVLGGCVGALGVVLTERVVDSYKAQKYLAKDVQLQVLQLRDKVTVMDGRLAAIEKALREHEEQEKLQDLAIDEAMQRARWAEKDLAALKKEDAQ